MGHVPIVQPPPRRLTADEVVESRSSQLRALYVGGGLGEGWDAVQRLERYLDVVLSGEQPEWDGTGPRFVLYEDPAKVTTRTYPPGHPRRQRRERKRRVRRLLRWLVRLPGRLWEGLGADERIDWQARGSYTNILAPADFDRPPVAGLPAPDPPPSDLSGELLAPPRRGDALRSAVPLPKSERRQRPIVGIGTQQP